MMVSPSKVYQEIGAKKQPISELPYFQEFLLLNSSINFAP
jgi:hypothetical protein